MPSSLYLGKNYLFIVYWLWGKLRFKGPGTWEPSHRDQRAFPLAPLGLCLGLATWLLALA